MGEGRKTSFGLRVSSFGFRESPQNPREKEEREIGSRVEAELSL
jgi:hypothetical protein